MWDGSEVFSGLVYSVITAPNGTLIATVIHYANEKWQKQQAPVYFLSYDDGHTWKGPRKYDESATVDDIAYTMNTSFVHDGEVFIVFRGGTSDMSPGGPQTLWASADNGESFSRRSTLPFDNAVYYWAAGSLDDGRIIVYTYDAHLEEGRPNGRTEHSLRDQQGWRPDVVGRADRVLRQGDPQHAAFRKAGRTVFHARAKRQQQAGSGRRRSRGRAISCSTPRWTASIGMRGLC